MRVSSLGAGLYGLESAYSPTLVAACKAIPGMRWDPALRQWVGYSDAFELLSRGGRIPLPLPGPEPSGPSCAGVIGAGFVACGEGGNYCSDWCERLAPLRGYQREAVSFLLQHKRALLGDAMGLGKTCVAITAASTLKARAHTLVVCPSYVRGVWHRDSGGEISKWSPQPEGAVFLPSGVKNLQPIPPSTRVIVIHYDILHAWAETLREWLPDVVIFDEVHALMSEKSQRSVAARAISTSATYVWGLSGTPLTNRPRDLWNVVDTICPGRFGSFFAYGLRHAGATKEAVTPTKTVWKFDGATHLDELRGRLSHFMLRRTAADVALELPPKTRQLVPVTVPAKARLMPDASAKAMRDSLDKAADAKIPEAIKLLEEHANAGHKVICFTYRRSVAESICNALRMGSIESEVVHGGVPTLRRGGAIDRCRGAASGSVLCATIDSSATGIDLSYADVVVFCELTWEPHELLQAEARAHRWGQQKPVLIQYIIAGGSTDELIANVVINKLAVFEAAIGATGEELAADLRGSEEDILNELYGALGIKPEVGVR